MFVTLEKSFWFFFLLFYKTKTTSKRHKSLKFYFLMSHVIQLKTPCPILQARDLYSKQNIPKKEQKKNLLSQWTNGCGNNKLIS